MPRAGACSTARGTADVGHRRAGASPETTGPAPRADEPVPAWGVPEFVLAAGQVGIPRGALVENGAKVNVLYLLKFRRSNGPQNAGSTSPCARTTPERRCVSVVVTARTTFIFSGRTTGIPFTTEQFLRALRNDTRALRRPPVQTVVRVLLAEDDTVNPQMPPRQGPSRPEPPSAHPPEPRPP